MGRSRPSFIKPTRKRFWVSALKGITLGILQVMLDSNRGWDAHKILEEIKNINFPILEHQLNEISYLEAKKSYSSDDPAPSVSENGD